MTIIFFLVFLGKLDDIRNMGKRKRSKLKDTRHGLNQLPVILEHVEDKGGILLAFWDRECIVLPLQSQNLHLKVLRGSKMLWPSEAPCGKDGKLHSPCCSPPGRPHQNTWFLKERIRIAAALCNASTII
nr:chloride channel protein CLC-E [Ipomoea batatas]